MENMFETEAEQVIDMVVIKRIVDVAAVLPGSDQPHLAQMAQMV